MIVNDVRRQDYEIYKDAKKALPYMTDDMWEQIHVKAKEYNQLIKLESELVDKTGD
ncbi:hypothetical protein LCGC14_1081170 [marine sediment metagenome]|uniref:Uncharacterized protein n=1 Tax=marine sediment metagenome TaxID=412755 RepID=A0A0F9MJX7_9ZZZZ